MSWGGVSVLSGPVAAPLSPEDMRARLRIDDPAEDGLLASFIAAAVAMIDGPAGVGVAMMRQTWRLTLDALPAHGVMLPGAPVVEVQAVRYRDPAGDFVEIAPEFFRLVPGSMARVVPTCGRWPLVMPCAGAVEIDYTLGALDPAGVPADLVAAVALIVGHLFENREGVTLGGAPAEVPFGVRYILDRHRRGGVA